jgi:phosphatidylglycerol:prolipoprotein diacylglycerol transferase
MALLGIFATGVYSCRICKKTGYDDNNAIFLLLFVAIGVFVGGHMLYWIVNFNDFIQAIKFLTNNFSLNTIINSFIPSISGSIFYGGLYGGISVAVLYLHINKEQQYLVDIIAPGIPLFHFFGRIGCFLGGCCYGIECNIGITFRHSLVESANNISRFPVQLLEAGYELILFLILDYMRKKNLCKNKLLYTYLLAYSTGRFFIEYLRGDEYRGFFGAFSTSQIISIITFIITLILFNRKTLKCIVKLLHN